jgi:hypothetical protein
MMVLSTGMKEINNELRRTQNELRHSSDIPVTRYETVSSSLFRTRMTRIARIFTDTRASVSYEQSVFYRNPSAFICVHLRLMCVSLSDRAKKIKGEV